MDARSENDASLVMRLDWRGVSLLFTGDIGWRAEQEIVARGPPAPALVLKVAHHGSRFGSSEPFLAATRPTLAVISAGARNPFQHPRPETLARLQAAGARVLPDGSRWRGDRGVGRRQRLGHALGIAHDGADRAGRGGAADVRE